MGSHYSTHVKRKRDTPQISEDSLNLCTRKSKPSDSGFCSEPLGPVLVPESVSPGAAGSAGFSSPQENPQKAQTLRPSVGPAGLGTGLGP